MKKLDKFVLKSFIGPLVLTFFIVQIILILQFLWMYIDELAGKGLEFKVLSELLFEFALTFVPMALPLAILLASLMTFGNMGEFSELTALKSSGIPLQRIMRPVIVLVAIISLISFVFSNNVQPYANKQARMLLFDIRRKRPEMNIQAGLFNSDIEGFSIRVGSKDPSTNRLDKLIIYDHRDVMGNVSVTVADSGYMQVTPDETALKMTLYNGFSYNEMAEKNPDQALKRYPFRKDSFKQQTIVVSLTGFDLERTKMDLFKSSSVSKNVNELIYFADSIRKNTLMISRTYYKEFSETRLYTERNYLTPKNIKPDTTKPVNYLYFDPVKIYDTISIEEKKETLIRAIAKAREAANYVNQKKDYIHSEVKSLRQFEVELHKKLTFAFACIVFFLIGAPLGAIIRKGGLGTPAVISILFFVVYYVISISAEKMVKENLVNTYLGMWASSYILLPIGVFLTYKATTDSSILNVETYKYFFRRISGLLNIAGKIKKNENPSSQ